MAFKRALSERFSALVTVMVPNEQGGFDKNTFTAKFLRPTTDQRDELAALTNVELCRRQLVGWDLQDGDTHEEVPFSRENLEALLQIAPTPLATALAFWEAVNGARTKN
jgi:hypothetical protein